MDLPAALSLEIQTAARRGLLAGAQFIKLAAMVGAPFEEVPKHGEHLRDTAFTRIHAPAEGSEAVDVGFTAFWALWQHEKMNYHHKQGHAKFLELAFIEQGEHALQVTADTIREAIGE